MRRILKAIVITVGLVLIGIAVVAILLSNHVADILRQNIREDIASLFNTDTELHSLRFAPLRRGIALEGLTIYNPTAFKSGPALRCESVVVQFELMKLFSERPSIRKIFVDGIEVLLRHEIGEGTNIGQLARTASRVPDEATSGRALIVRDFESREGKFTIDTNLVPGPGLSMRMAPFKLEEVSEGNTITPAKVSALFLKNLVAEALLLKGLLRPVANKLRSELDTL